jgi:hypothetical protein
MDMVSDFLMPAEDGGVDVEVEIAVAVDVVDAAG